MVARNLIFLLLLLLGGRQLIARSSSLDELSTTMAPYDWDAEGIHALTMDEALDLAIAQSYESRMGVERIYQARQNIEVTIGRLLPSLNFSIAFNLVTKNYPVALIPLAGFIFPSNWFRWRESKLFFEAERSSFAWMIANQANLIEILFYQMRLLQSALEIYDQRIGDLDALLARAKTAATTSLLTQTIEETKIFRFTLDVDRRSIRNSIYTLHSEIFHALGIPPEQWKNFSIAPVPPGDPKTFTRLRGDDVYEEILKRSQELKAIDYLILASRFTTLVRAFEFAIPFVNNYDINLGFGYPAVIKITRSHTRILEIRRQETASLLRVNLDKISNAYNAVIGSYKSYQQGQECANSLLTHLDHLLTSEGYFNHNTIDAFRGMLFAQLGITQVLYLSQTGRAQLRRLLWEGPHYQKILRLVGEKKPEKHLNLWQKLENTKINHALKKAKLTLP